MKVDPRTLRPTQIIGLGYNDKSYYGDGPYPDPFVFLKSPNNIAYDYDDIFLPNLSTHKYWCEPELAIVMGAGNEIFGYTIANDITRDNIHKRDHHLAFSKAFPGSCVLGVVDTDTSHLPKAISGWVYGEYEEDRAGFMEYIWSPYHAIQNLHRLIGLREHDIILMGTPPTVGSDSVPLTEGCKYICAFGDSDIGIINPIHERREPHE